MTKEKSLEKFNPNKKFSVKGSKYHFLYWDLDGKRPPPKIIIWYLNISILIAISIWFIPESINYYAITHIFIDFMQTLVPKIAQFKELAGEGHVAKTMPFYVSLIWFWIFATFLPLIYVQSKFMSKKVLLGDFEYYYKEIFSNNAGDFLSYKRFILMVVIIAFTSWGLWIMPPSTGDTYFKFMNHIPTTALQHFIVLTIFYGLVSVFILLKARIILYIYKHKQEKKI
jgi:hypothetical protein